MAEEKKPDEVFITANVNKPRKQLRWIIGIPIGIVAGLMMLAVILSLAQSEPESPAPAIVSSFMDGTPSTLTDYAIRVVGDVRNDGAGGTIVFEATVFEGKQLWTKTATAVMTAKETRRFEIVFDEPSLAAKQEFGARAYPLDK